LNKLSDNPKRYEGVALDLSKVLTSSSASVTPTKWLGETIKSAGIAMAALSFNGPQSVEISN
jgi:hypothetical protein